MRSTTTVTNSVLVLAAGLLLSGCAAVPNQYREDGPATTMAWHSPTSAEIHANTEPQELRTRDYAEARRELPSRAVTHWPLYFEDPFVDKGHGREGLNKYRLGWEDWVALPYGISRHTVNWLFLPASAVVTPPWTLMESDGRLSQQLLGYDHDATKSTASAFD